MKMFLSAYPKHVCALFRDSVPKNMLLDLRKADFQL